MGPPGTAIGMASGLQADERGRRRPDHRMYVLTTAAQAGKTSSDQGSEEPTTSRTRPARYPARTSGRGKTPSLRPIVEVAKTNTAAIRIP